MDHRHNYYSSYGGYDNGQLSDEFVQRDPLRNLHVQGHYDTRNRDFHIDSHSQSPRGYESTHPGYNVNNSWKADYNPRDNERGQNLFIDEDFKIFENHKDRSDYYSGPDTRSPTGHDPRSDYQHQDMNGTSRYQPQQGKYESYRGQYQQHDSNGQRHCDGDPSYGNNYDGRNSHYMRTDKRDLHEDFHRSRGQEDYDYRRDHSFQERSKIQNHLERDRKLDKHSNNVSDSRHDSHDGDDSNEPYKNGYNNESDIRATNRRNYSDEFNSKNDFHRSQELLSDRLDVTVKRSSYKKRESQNGFRDSGLYENPDTAFSPYPEDNDRSTSGRGLYHNYDYDEDNDRDLLMPNKHQFSSKDNRRSEVYDNIGFEDEGERPSYPSHVDNILRRKSRKSKVVIEDGSFTVAFRKRRNSGDNRKSARRSTLIRKSLIQEGYLPKHSTKTMTLKDRMRALKEQKSVEGVSKIYRDKILQEPEVQLKGFAGWHHRQSKNWTEFKQAAGNVYKALELWSGSFRTIEGRFGTAIMNYFRFIRWLMFMNLYMAMITIGVTLIPQVLLSNAQYNETVYDETQYCAEEYNYFIANKTDSEDVPNQILDVLQGTGWMEQTVLFYGAYNNRTMLDNTTQYNMSLGYILAVGGAFLVSFFLIVRNTGKGMKQGVMNRDSTVNQYTNKVLCGGWDFCINETKAAKRRHQNILQELQGDLETQRIFWKKQNRELKEKFILYSIRIAVNVLVVAILGASLYLIFFTNDKMLELQQEDSIHGNINAVVKALIEYLPSITITLLNVIVPVIFVKLVTFEDYMPAYGIRLTLLRIILLRLASLGVLIGSLYRIITSEDNTTQRCGNSRWETSSSHNSSDQTIIKCWETYVGQQFYKLIVMDFLVVIISTVVGEFPRRIIYNKFHERNKLVNLVGLQEFNLPKVVLDIVYSQTLCWIGLFFCPLTPVITFLKCFIFFYIRKASLLRNCIQPVRPYRTSRSNSLFAAVLFLSFLLSSIPLAVLIASFSPSQSCGPFRLYNGEVTFFDTIPHIIQTWPSTAVNIFHFIGSMAFMVPAIIVLCSVIYIYWLAKEGNKREAELLQEDLTQEGRDKQFLVAQVNEILQHLEATSS